MTRHRGAIGATLLVFVLAACGGGSSPSGSASASPSASEQASVEPSGGESSGPAIPSLPSEAADLEALIPDEVGGLTLTKASMQGSEFLASGESDPATQKFLEDLGVNPEDVAVAFGFGFAADGSSVGIFVFRAEGAEAGRLVSVFKEATDTDRESPLEWESTSVGGKDVERAVDPEADNMIDYLYARDDVLYLVSAGTEDVATEALGKLP
jgi:hypothetical protein